MQDRIQKNIAEIESPELVKDAKVPDLSRASRFHLFQAETALTV